jgi:hypothetical protein
MSLHTLRTILLGLLGVLVLSRCSTKQKLDEGVDLLVQSAVSNNYQGFTAQSHPELVKAFPAKSFEELSHALAKLGAYQSKSMTGMEVSTERGRTGNFSLSFAKGKVTLELTLKEGKLVAFKFSGDAMKQALREVSNEAYDVFKVNTFEFLDADKKPKNNIYQAGQPVRFRMIVQGLKRSGESLKLKVQLRVKDAEGKIIFAKPDFLDTTLSIKPDDPSLATVKGDLEIPTKGMYKIELLIADGVSNRSLEHSQVLSIEAKP